MLPAPDLLRAGNRQSRKRPQRVTRNRGGSPRSRSVPLSPSSRIYAARVSRDVISNVRPSCGVLRGVLPCCRACVSHSSARGRTEARAHLPAFPHTPPRRTPPTPSRSFLCAFRRELLASDLPAARACTSAPALLRSLLLLSFVARLRFFFSAV